MTALVIIYFALSVTQFLVYWRLVSHARKRYAKLAMENNAKCIAKNKELDEQLAVVKSQRAAIDELSVALHDALSSIPPSLLAEVPEDEL